MGNYVAHHVHSDLSLLDSCTPYQQYIDKAVTDGMQAISISEHGKPLNWTAKKQYCDSKGIRYLHSVEIYLTESHAEKVRDNYHTILIARNEAGVRELNELVSLSGTESHFYYVNRLSFDEFLNISDNIISTSACLASPLNKLPQDHPYYDRLCRKYTFFEIQPHNHPDQFQFNQTLYELAGKYGKKLIAGTDAHSIDQYKSECREILLESKHKRYDDDGFDLTWKTYDELADAFRIQNALPADVYMEAIDNTNLLLDMTEDFELDTAFKYPILYGSADADAEKFVEVVHQKFDEKVRSGVIPESEVPGYEKAIAEELDVLQKLNMSGFMLSMSELISWCRDQGMPVGPSRGSVGGSRVAYITDITDLDPEKWHTNFYRFANPDRLEAGDVDVDVQESDRPKIFRHIVESFGEAKTARVAAYGTLADKAAIADIGRCLRERCSKIGFEDYENPWSIHNINRIKSEYEQNPERTKEKYPELFYYFDGLLGTRVSQSIHPAGIIISSVTLDDNYGTFLKDGERCLMLDMDAAHDVNLIKYDLLILKTVQVINEACQLIGIPYPRMHEVDFDDQKVWEDMRKSNIAIFQMESAFAGDNMRKFKPHSIDDITLVTAAIRPSGQSYRDRLMARKPNKNASKQMDGILKDNLGYLVYQEDILRFLMEVCELSGGEADTVRRGIAKKRPEILEASLPKIMDGYCRHSDKPREVAESEVKEIIRVIEDASAYMFGRNHAIGYSLLSYLCAYFRYYYPLEFITAFLNNAANDEDIQNGTELAKRYKIKVENPKWGISRSNYFFDKERNTIAKGLASVKYIGSAVADELYQLSKSKTYDHFSDLVLDIVNNTSINTRQLDILVKIDFFSEFGNQRELLRIIDLCGVFKWGDAKQIKKSAISDERMEEIVARYSVGVTKSGVSAKSYTLLDVPAILRGLEDLIKSMNMSDLDDIIKIRNYKDIMGYLGYITGKEEDRRKLYVTGVKPIDSRYGKAWAYSVYTKSIGSGKEARFTARRKIYDKDPLKEGDIIYMSQSNYVQDGAYYNLVKIQKII